MLIEQTLDKLNVIGTMADACRHQLQTDEAAALGSPGWARFDLLAIDDWMLAPLRDAERRDLTEVVKDRAERASTLIVSHLRPTCSTTRIASSSRAALCDGHTALRRLVVACLSILSCA